ncbi:MAG: hypothetical protein V4736_00295 [Bdellovibrionota bacterium]
MRSKTLKLCFFAIAVSPAYLLAATPEDLLRSAWKDTAVEASAKAVSIAESGNNWNPFWQMQFKFEKENIDSTDRNADIRLYPSRGFRTLHETSLFQKGSLRFYPKGFSDWRTSARYQNVIEKNERTLQKEALSKALVSRYNLIARAAMLKEKKEISKDLSGLTKKLDRVISLAAQRDRAELKNFLKMKSDFHKTALRVTDINQSIALLDQELKEMGAPEVSTVDLSNLATMDDLRAKLAEIEKMERQTSLAGQVAKEDMERAEAALAFDKARDEKWLDYVEITAEEDSRERVYGIALAINLPFLAASDPRLIDKRSEYQRSRAESLQAVRENDRILQSSISELKGLLDLHKSLSSTTGLMNGDRLKRTSQAIAVQDPLLSLELQRGWQESREQMLDLEFRIRSLLITVMQESSYLAENPEVNHLSKNQKRIL